MSWIYLFVIAFINSIDNIGIGVAYSVGRIKIGIKKNIIISFLAFFVSYLAAFLGDILSSFLSDTVCSIVSMAILIFMGIKMIYKSFKGKDSSDIEINSINYKEAISIGIVLALDDVGSSISSSLIGHSSFMIAFPYFIISMIIFILSDYGTKFFSKLKIGRKATIVSGAIMILMGLLQLIE
ncbi:manganese efflux pump [Clostridium sp. C8-1-8]|uniref:manganese efflux pump MntP n=1 Tax=Clostridium sp. C8-1-8 TaxID=2698831 RepID=UPI00136A5481|nr:manganese efflux pump [Clostridium sp. C8-1-8]